METTWHRVVGGVTAVAAAHLHPLPLPGVLLSVGVAVITAGGAASPDIDNQRFWKRMDRWLPDEWLGDGGPLGHRRIMHSWLIPAGIWWYVSRDPQVLAGVGSWTLLGFVYGWLSHLVMDMLFGVTPRGVPLVLWWGRFGLGLRSDGWPARTTGALLGAAGLWWAVGLVAPGLAWQPEVLAGAGRHLLAGR